MASLQKNVASQNLTFCLVLASSGAAFVATSTTNISGNVTKDGGAQTTVSGTFALQGNGQYNYAPTQAETNATDVGFLFTATGVIPVNIDFHTDLTDAGGNLQVDVTKWNGTAVSSPATAGIPDVNVKNMNNVAATSITTINANQGTTQPINFTGSGSSALVKSDAIDINSIAASSVTTISANIGTTQPVNFTGTGASALVQSDTRDISGSAVSTTAAQIGINVVNWNNAPVSSLPSNFTALSIDGSGNVATTSNVKKNASSNGFMFTMTFSSNNAPAPAQTVSGTRAIDGGAFGSTTNSVTEIANGWYTINLAAADTNGNHLAFRFAAANCNDTDIQIVTQP